MMAAATVSQGKAFNKMAKKEKSLREILDGLVVSQKQDIHAFSRGHLNEANLPKPPDRAKHQSWESATKPNIQLVPKGVLPPTKRNTLHEDNMKKTILHFSVGTSGNANVPITGKANPTPVSRSTAVLGSRSKSRKSHNADGVLIEELTLPEALLAKTNYHNPKSKLERSSRDFSQERHRSPDQEHDPHTGTPKERLLPLLKREFMPAHLEAVTKRDQLLKMRQFENVVLRKQDVVEQNIMSGVKAVAHLEARLQQDLDQLKYHGYGPNFHRLQVFSNIFDDLMDESNTFGVVLHMIKNEYDGYIASLLDGQVAKHQILSSQVEQLASRDNNSETLKEEMSNVRLMEEDGKQLLEENERLRKELEQETYLTNKPIEEDSGSGQLIHRREEPRQDLLDQIEDLKATILEKLDMMNVLKTKLRKEFVPSTVCAHLEQCIKETEVETQKLTSQKEFFERSIADMEHDLERAIETADTTEKDARRVWKRVTAVKAVDRSVLNATPGAGVTTTGPGGVTRSPYHDSDDDQDEQKWNWYIS